MPYRSNRQLPKGVKNNLSTKAQSIWRSVFNSAEQGGASEKSAIRQAWGAVRNAGYVKNKNGRYIKKAKNDAPDYRVTTLTTRNCSTCRFYINNRCALYKFKTEANYICNSWETKNTKQEAKKSVADENLNKKLEFEVLKVDEQLGIVFGWGMVCKVNGDDYYDTDNEHFGEQFMLKAASDFMKGARINNDSHTPNDVGTVVHSFPLTTDIAKSMGVSSLMTGWMVGVQPDSDSLAKFASGEYKGFSIEGGAAFIDEEE